ncbi:MAG: tetratricopeptide repeat protein [Deltaproteobacteria bacterium]|nr:tetratricopeptide repeat protein [Deltaproteobacteria bacterium]
MDKSTGERVKGLSFPAPSLAFFLLLFWLTVPMALLAPTNLLANSLKNVSLGTMDEYSRLVFTFDDHIEDVILRRDDVDTFVLDFGEIDASGQTAGPTDALVKSVALERDGQRLVARVTLNTNKFEVRHFLSRDTYSCIVDFKNLQAPDQAPATDETGQPILTPEERLQLHPPDFAEVVKGLSLFMVSTPDQGPAERLVQSALSDLSNGRIDTGIQKLERFKADYPNHHYADPAWFLIGDAYFAKGLPDNFLNATDAWRLAIEAFPDSFAAPRAAFMIGEANRLMDFTSEAAGFYKLAAENYPESNYASLSLLKAADMQLAMGMTTEARQTLAPLLEEGVATAFGRLAMAREGMADYLDTLYSQACEKFRMVLNLDPNLYLLYPDILYALGDSYSYLNRPDLTVLFMEHALNLMPDHPKADVMLARIGNAYQDLNNQNESISFFNVARDRYPDRDGGLVSEIRLADMGALRAFFSPERVFDALERGARQATVKMYDDIISQASESPLLQLAYLKIGQAQAADGENSEAIKWLSELVSKYPKGVLFEEARPILSRVVVNEAQERFDLGQYDQVDRLNASNESYLEGPDLIRFKRLLAQSYENLGQNDKALEVWKFIEDQSPEKRLADQQALVEAALKSGQPMEAFKQLKSTLAEFPETEDYVTGELAKVEKLLANLSGNGDVTDLITFRNDPAVLTLTPVSQAALSDAIYILVDKKRYDQASALMDTYRDQYPDDELSPEYVLTQSKMDRRQRRYEKSWDRLADFRIQYPEDPRVPQTILDTIADARSLERLPDAYRYEELFRQLYPDDIRSRNMILDRATEQFNLGQTQAGLDTLKYFQTEYPGDPGTPATYLSAYRKLMDTDRPDEARAALAELRAKYPSDPLTKESYAMEYKDLIALDRPQQAIDVMAAFERLYPNDGMTRDSYVTQYRDLINLNVPDQAFEILGRFEQTYPDDPRQPDLLLEKAKDLFALGRNREGLQAWNEFLSLYPNDERIPELTLLTARMEIREGLNQQGIDHYHQFTNNYPQRQDRPDVMLELAAIETDIGAYPQAFEDLSNYRRDYPDSPQEAQVLLDQVNLAKSMGRIDDVGNLYDIYRSKFTANPQFGETFLDQTRVEMAAGRNAQALATLERGIVADEGLDDTKQVQDLLLGLYLEEGRVEDWAGAMEEFLRRTPNGEGDLADRFAKYSQVAQVYQELGRSQDAQRNFELALANRPPEVSGESLYTIAGAYKRMGLQEQYKSVLQIIATLPDPLWQNVANQELGNLS